MGIAAKGFELTACLQAAAAIEAELARLTTALTEAQFHTPPLTGGWSVAYCIEHLVLVGRALLPKWDTALQQAVQSKTGCDAFSYYWWQRSILRHLENPSRFQSRTAAAFVPQCRCPIDDTVARFRRMQREFLNRFNSSRGLDLGRTKVPSPFVSWIRHSLGFSFDLALAHERRHLRQAMEVRRRLAEHTTICPPRR
jgi:DinB family protein